MCEAKIKYTLRQYVYHKMIVLIIITHICTCICIRKNYKNGEFSPIHF